MKKKGFARVLAVSLALGLFFMTACNKDTTIDDDSNNAEVTGSTVSGQETSSGQDTQGDASDSTDDTTADAIAVSVDNTDFYVSEEDMTLNEEDLDTSEENAVTITMDGSSITTDGGEGVSVEGSDVYITAAGTYVLTGTLTDGSLCIAAGSKDEVHLIFDQLSINNSDGAALYSQSGKLTITLKEGTINRLSDGAEYTEYADDASAPTACLFSQDDLCINGTGSLVVHAQTLDGITTKDDFKLVSGNVTVTAGDDGIVGRDSLQIYGGVLEITSSGDGLKASNDEKNGKGYIYICGGTITIESEQDGIQAVSSLLISGGTISITCGGGSQNASQKSNGMNFGWGGFSTTTDTTDSTKGLKTDCNLVITGGTITVDSAEDTIHSNLTVTISGGALTLIAGDDGIHADETVTISDGEITITKSYEGIEAKTIQIDGGTIHVTASDDGLNATEGSTTTTTGWGGMGMSSGNALLSITGGYLYVDADGDGLDSNGSVVMSGGICIVDGPTNSGNGALDYDSAFTQTGGILIAAGASGMAQSISSGGQCYLNMTYSSMQAAGNVIRITDADGNNVLTYTPSKTYSHIVISSSELVSGESYTLWIGGSVSGTQTDGLYEDDAVYTGGTQVAEFTASNSGASFSESGETSGTQGGFGGGGFGGGGFGGGGRR